jgi:hypothetical protein
MVDALGEFAGYWLTDAAEADYDGDGIVNIYEYSQLAKNWLR